MSKNFVVVLVVAVLVSACAFTPHEVDITAQAPRTESTIGAGVNIDLQVIDDRDSTVVGQRGAGMLGAAITAGNVLQVLENELATIFEANGFNVSSPGSEHDAEVEARLRALKFFIESGLFVGTENTSVVVAIEAEKLGSDFDRSYRSSSEHDTLFVPGENAIDSKLNAALSDVFRQIANDRDLLAFLAQ